VLVAEDNVVNQKLIEIMLRKLGCQVAMAATGKELVDVLSSAPGDWDLIFMDIQMPEMDGFEALKVIRKQQRGDIPVVAMTAHAMPRHRQECLAAGMNDYISKPIRKPELIRILRQFRP
jgi:CheY-like chemotaxis protein